MWDPWVLLIEAISQCASCYAQAAAAAYYLVPAPHGPYDVGLRQ